MLKTVAASVFSLSLMACSIPEEDSKAQDESPAALSQRTNTSDLELNTDEIGLSETESGTEDEIEALAEESDDESLDETEPVVDNTEQEEPGILEVIKERLMPSSPQETMPQEQEASAPSDEAELAEKDTEIDLENHPSTQMRLTYFFAGCSALNQPTLHNINLDFTVSDTSLNNPEFVMILPLGQQRTAKNLVSVFLAPVADNVIVMSSIPRIAPDQSEGDDEKPDFSVTLDDEQRTRTRDFVERSLNRTNMLATVNAAMGENYLVSEFRVSYDFSTNTELSCTSNGGTIDAISRNMPSITT